MPLWRQKRRERRRRQKSPALLLAVILCLAQVQSALAAIVNTVVVSGQVGGNTVQSAAVESVDVANAAALLSINKKGRFDDGGDGTADPGDIINYVFTVRNTGNVTLSDVTVSDPLVPVTGGPLASLAPGKSDAVTFKAAYAITQADIDAGIVSNIATATGNDPSNTAVSADDTEITALNGTEGLKLVKSAVLDMGGDGIASAGDAVSYKFVVTNTGGNTLTDIAITDPLFAPGRITPASVASLAPAAKTTFTASYALTQSDVDSGKLKNIAAASATSPDGILSAIDSVVLNFAPSSSVALVKTGVPDFGPDGVASIGDIITYRFAVTNTGSTVLTNLVVSDPLVAVTGGPLASLAPGATNTKTYKAVYTLTQADLDAGQVINQASIEGDTPTGTVVNDVSDDDSATEDDPTVTPLTQNPGIALIKTVAGISDRNDNSAVDAGDVIHYKFTVTNTGDVPLLDVKIEDPLAIVSGGPLARLGVGKSNSTAFIARHVITNDDVLAGQFANQAEATGVTGTGTTVSDLSDDGANTEDDPTVTLIESKPGIALLKSISSITDKDGDGETGKGDVIHYTFSVTNTGNVPLNGVTVVDKLVAVKGGPVAVLATGQTDATTFTAAYVITQANVTAGEVRNQATATGEVSPGGEIVSDVSDESDLSGNGPTITAIAQRPAIALVKTVASITDVNANGLTDSGDILNYSFAVSNTGNVPLRGVSVTDPLVLVSGGPLRNLAVGETDSRTFTAVYTVTPADASAGKVENQASATGTTPKGLGVSDLSDDSDVSGGDPTVTPIVKPRTNLTKTALVSQVRRGERVPYEIVASAVGAGPVQIVDIVPPGFAFASGSATVNGTRVAPAIDGRNLTFADLLPSASGTITLKLSLIASTSLRTGRYINRAELRDATGATLLATAQAPVEIVAEHVFDCGEIIGRVFDDVNRNGYADDGEPGLPAVRVVTVKGLLITTDKHGRFHVPCADIPDAATGSNFVMKLDVRTLPTGYHLTTENPRDVRLTRGKITKLNFGASLLREVRLDLRDDTFLRAATKLKPEWNKGIAKLLTVLAAEPSVLRIIYTGTDLKLAVKRLAAVKDLIAVQWKKHGRPYRLVIDTRSVVKE